MGIVRQLLAGFPFGAPDKRKPKTFPVDKREIIFRWAGLAVITPQELGEA